LKFVPACCPHSQCPSRKQGAAFLWHRRGSFVRECDRKLVQRFFCRVCERTFSTQSFRLDYRLKKPELHFELFDHFVSKCTHRQAARMVGCHRKTVAQRLILLSKHAREFQRDVLAQARKKGGIHGRFQLDELETFEHSRKLAPVTMPVLMELHSYFVLHAEAAPLPARGNLKPHEEKRKQAREAIEGKRKSGSRAAVVRCLKVLKSVAPKTGMVVLASDRKTSYAHAMRELFGTRAEHHRHPSTGVRNYQNPLFPINHTLAMMRDGISRLVRRSWGASKKRTWLARHTWIWIAYRNYIRTITNKARDTTAAMALGLLDVRHDKRSLFTWSVLAGRRKR
jgi:transposase-like protein